MRKLIPIFIFSLIMAWLSDRSSVYEIDECGIKRYVRKDKLLYAVMSIALAAFVGLRTRGNDTYTYRLMYENLPQSWDAIKGINWLQFAQAPGLKFVSGFLRAIGATTQDFFMVFALFTVLIYLWFLRKYTDDIWLSVYYFITMGVWSFTMAAIKQTVAVAFLLIATDRAIQKKYIPFFFWVLIAELFHPYAFVYLIIPLLFFPPWTGRTQILLVGTVLVSLSLPRLLNGIVEMTDAMGADYSVESFTGEGVNIFRVLVVWVPVILSFLGREQFRYSEDRVDNLVINASMINALIMFIGLFGTANYFARLANYFLIFQALSLPRLLNIFDAPSKRLVKNCSVVLFFGYFYYSMVLANGAFDNVYNFITIFDFLKQL